MLDIVLLFSGSSRKQIEIADKVTVYLKENYRKPLRFTFIVPNNLYKRLSRQPEIDYVNSSDYVHSRFSSAIRVSRVLTEKSQDIWFDTLVSLLILKFKLIENNEPTLNGVRQPLRRDPRKCSILFQSTYNPCDGYGSSAEAIALQAAKLDNQFRWQPFQTVNDADYHAQPSTKLLLNRSLRYVTPDHYLLYHTPNLRPPEYYRAKKEGASLSLLTMFETTSIPYIWPIRINEWFDRLIVPSVFCKNLFRKEGVKIPIHMVPLGIDPARWPYRERVPPEDRPFRFLVFANAHWDCPRKNFDIVVDAFTDKFENRKDVELVVKSSPGARTPRRTSFPPNVRIIEERLPQHKIVELLHNVDCLVFPSSGEGFGLPPREAMATGLPVIITNWGGLAEIAQSNISFPIEPSGMKSATHLCDWLTNEPGGMELGEMVKISRHDLADIMEQIFKDQEGAFKIGRAGCQYVLNNETYLHSVTKLYRIFYPKTFRDYLVTPSKETNMKIELEKTRKRKDRYFLYFKVTNSPEPYETKQPFRVRVKQLFVNGKEISWEKVAAIELPSSLLAKEVVKGRLLVDLAEMDEAVDSLTCTIGIVTEGIRWHCQVPFSI